VNAPRVSVIVRTRDEERWIEPCLRMVFGQTHRNVEVVIVDNRSRDRTLERARAHPVKVVEVDEFLPGRALNDGIRASTGEILVCLSAHCIPAGEGWLAALVAPLADPEVAGSYGRQEPLPFSSDHDKRDLLTVFGLDAKMQVRDPFFHNANSALRRTTWERFPFDETVKNLEDRVWGQAVVSAGLKIAYAPDASVYHWHGIHQGGDERRARGVVRVLESIHGVADVPASLAPSALRSLAVIPVRANRGDASQADLLRRTVASARASAYVGEVVVATDDEALATVARAAGAQVAMRPASFSGEGVDVLDVVAWALEGREAAGESPDVVVALEVTYPFRPAGLVDAMLERLVAEGLDTVVAGRREMRGVWLAHEGDVAQVGEGFKPRSAKRDAAWIGLLGLGLVTRAVSLRAREVFARNVGIHEVREPLAGIEVREARTYEALASLLPS
jgi:hypothetical protein